MENIQNSYKKLYKIINTEKEKNGKLKIFNKYEPKIANGILNYLYIETHKNMTKEKLHALNRLHSLNTKDYEEVIKIIRLELELRNI